MKSHTKICWFVIFYVKISAKPLRIRFNKVNGFIRVYDGTRYLVYLKMKNMISFTTRLDIL